MRRVALWLGTTMILAGLVLVGYFLWQLFGTNLVARQRQQENVAALRESWSEDAGVTQGGQEASPGTASALMRIPRFGRSYEMPVLEGTSDAALAQGFAHFEDSAGPGQRGNYALAAHRITHGEPLRRMPDLRPGDEVLVETRTHVYSYVLDTDPRELVVPFTAGWVLDDFPDNPATDGVEPDPSQGRHLITLTTCAEIFHTDERMVAFGHLESVEAKQEPTQ